jgi:hypothetical protein
MTMVSLCYNAWLTRLRYLRCSECKQRLFSIMNCLLLSLPRPTKCDPLLLGVFAVLDRAVVTSLIV